MLNSAMDNVYFKIKTLFEGVFLPARRRSVVCHNSFLVDPVESHARFLVLECDGKLHASCHKSSKRICQVVNAEAG